LKFRSLLCLALIHTLVDTTAQLLTPLWPRLQETFSLSPWAFTALYATWQASASVSQPLFACCGDRWNTRWIVWLGPGLGVVCLGLIGFAGHPILLALLLMVGGFGIGAFHPEAAVGVVEASGERIANALSIFTFGGMVGLAIGPTLSGTLVDRFGLQGLAWTLVPSILLLCMLTLVRGPSGDGVEGHSPGPPLRQVLEGRWLATTILLSVATLRVVPALGVPLWLPFLLKQRGLSEQAIGLSVSLVLLRGGIGTLVCPLFCRPGKEIPVLVGTGLPAAGCLILLAADNSVAYYVGLIGSGFLVQGAVPILIAYSQRLLPRGRRLAASLSLGTSWGLGALIVGGFPAYFSALGRLEWMFWAMAPFALAAALGSYRLPRLEVQPVRDASSESTLEEVAEVPSPVL